MAYILLFIFILFIVVPVVRIMYNVWILRRRMRRFMEDPFGEAAFGGQSQSRTRSGFAYGHTQARRETPGKKIPRDVGEYVAFTEYEGRAESSQSASASGTVRTESQITDVEWIDIEK